VAIEFLGRGRRAIKVSTLARRNGGGHRAERDRMLAPGGKEGTERNPQVCRGRGRAAGKDMKRDPLGLQTRLHAKNFRTEVILTWCRMLARRGVTGRRGFGIKMKLKRGGRV